jgi:hypothetical protein
MLGNFAVNLGNFLYMLPIPLCCDMSMDEYH